MDRKNFPLEEYKSLQAAIARHQAAYFNLENYTFGGMLVVYGVLFGITSHIDSGFHIPVAVWWGVFLLLCVACIRCWGHYVVIRKLARYITKIESLAYFDSSSLIGFERAHLHSWPGPWTNLAINAFCWLALLGIGFGFALFNTMNWPIP